MGNKKYFPSLFRAFLEANKIKFLESRDSEFKEVAQKSEFYDYGARCVADVCLENTPL